MKQMEDLHAIRKQADAFNKYARSHSKEVQHNQPEPVTLHDIERMLEIALTLLQRYREQSK